MKDRVREAVFNLLGSTVENAHAIDLFAGTGALGFEAISRGATRATFFELHRPTAASLDKSAAALGVTDAVLVLAVDTLRWFERPFDPREVGEPERPWVVFCSPPFEFYASRRDEMTRLLANMIAAAPLGSVFVIESDWRFDFALPSRGGEWDVREYPPSRVGLLYLPEASAEAISRSPTSE